MGQFIRKRYMGVQQEDTRAALVVMRRRLISEGRAVRSIRDLPARFFTECELPGVWIEPFIGAVKRDLQEEVELAALDEDDLGVGHKTPELPSRTQGQRPLDGKLSWPS